MGILTEKIKYRLISKRRVVKCYCMAFYPNNIPAKYRLVFVKDWRDADIELKSSFDAASLLRYAMKIYATEQNPTEVNEDIAYAITDGDKGTCEMFLRILIEQNPVAYAPFIYGLMMKIGSGIYDSIPGCIAFKYAFGPEHHGLRVKEVEENIMASEDYTDLKLKQLTLIGK